MISTVDSMDAFESLEILAISDLCRSNSGPRRWRWLSSKFCAVILSCCLLPSPSEGASIQAGYVWNGDQGFATITGPTTYKRISITYLASSSNGRYGLALKIETSMTSNPICYLETVDFSVYIPSPATLDPSGSYVSNSYNPWSHPCPRRQSPNGNCTFAFTKDGEMQLNYSVAGNSVLLWSSNTTGLGATTLGMQNYDINNGSLIGPLVLYNASGSIVWANLGSDRILYECGEDLIVISQAAAKKAASVFTLMAVVLSVGAALISLWESRSRRNQLLVVAIVVCYLLLLPSTSGRTPISKGFSANLQYVTVYAAKLYANTTVASTGSVDNKIILAASPSNRTALQLHISLISNWGPTCYLEVVADTENTNILTGPSNAVNTFEYVPWSAPCPRTLYSSSIAQAGICTMEFTLLGEIQVTSGVQGIDQSMWRSNTSGLGATTLAVLDSDPTGRGSVVLRNALNEVVWRNVVNISNKDFQCVNPTVHVNPASRKVGIIAGTSLGAVAALLLLGLFIAPRMFRYGKRRTYRKQGEFRLVDQILVPRMFTYKELSKATNNFSKSEILGSGGFGAVYKGTLPSGELVAVKQMKYGSKHGEESFQAEVASLSHIRHRNLLPLRGWCHEEEQLLLVYDYMCNGSLDEWLFHFANRNGEGSLNLTGKETLPLTLRHSILCGVGAALAYLHAECPQCVLHRDIKSSNVLLDARLNAYLGDFGLARLIDHQKMEKTTMAAGTFGYMAPEVPHTCKATKESDVYSFGVLMLEVMCGRRPVDIAAMEQGDGILVDNVWRAHEASNILAVADPRLTASPPPFEENSESHGEVELQEASLILVVDPGMLDVDPAMIHLPDAARDKEIVANLLHLGLLCCNPNPEDRPSMRVVSQLLQASQAETEMHLPPLPDFKPHAHHSQRGLSEVAMAWSSWSSSSGPNVDDPAQGASPPTSGVSSRDHHMLKSFASPDSSVFSGR